MITAVIFDLDGTVLDNEDVWEEAFVDVLRKSGAEVNQEIMDQENIHVPGVGLPANWKRILASPTDELVERLSIQVREYYKTNFGQGLKISDGFGDLIEKCRELGLSTALATSSYWDVIENELEELGLHVAFEVTTTGDEVLALKPDPEIYLLTSQKLGVDPENCLVVEDSLAGVESGASAGCQVVGLVSDYASAEALMAAGAKWAVEGMPEIAEILETRDAKTEIAKTLTGGI